MGQPNLETIIKEIKDRGLTAYEISKDLPLSEAGINKILNGNSSPRKSTLLLLHDYLFPNNKENKTVTQQKTPHEAVRFEDLVAKRVLEEIGPLLNGNTEKLLKAIMNIHIELNKIRNSQNGIKEKVDLIEQNMPE